MRCDQANNIPLHLYLETKGIYPVREKSTSSGDTEFWYISPLRSAERTASFKVSTFENAWYDHGLAKGGTVVDFVVQMYRYSVREALRDIERS